MAPARALRLPRHVCTSCIRQAVARRNYMSTASVLSAQDRMPRVANPSFWTSLIPRFLRRPTSEEEATERARKRGAGAEERRTGIVFLILGILVGSNAINIISLRREMLNFSRQTEAKLELLREIVGKVKKGEDVDVKKALGTGDPDQEKEWAQVMEELEKTDMLWESKKRRDTKLGEKKTSANADEARVASADADTSEAAKKPAPKFLM